MRVQHVVPALGAGGRRAHHPGGERAELARQVVLREALVRPRRDVPHRHARDQLDDRRDRPGRRPGEDVDLEAPRGQLLGDLGDVDVHAARVPGAGLLQRRGVDADHGDSPDHVSSSSPLQRRPPHAVSRFRTSRRAPARHTLLGVARNRPVGVVTRGTTNPNRLRRVRPLAGRRRGLAAARSPPRRPSSSTSATAPPRSPRWSCTTGWRGSAADVEVVGIEIDPDRVRAAQPLEHGPASRSRSAASRSRSPDGRRPTVVRAFNVLRQYAEAEVGAAWDAGPGAAGSGRAPRRRHLRRDRAPGLLGRRRRDRAGQPDRVAAAARPGPSVDVAERLPKALIHRNVPGRPSTRTWRPSTPRGTGPRRRPATGCGSAGWPRARPCAARGGRSSTARGAGVWGSSPWHGRRSGLSGRSRPRGARCRPRRSGRSRPRAAGRARCRCCPCGGSRRGGPRRCRRGRPSTGGRRR